MYLNADKCTTIVSQPDVQDTLVQFTQSLMQLISILRSLKSII